jgi:peptidoglycan/xylan/chitin deacetylase (PgdA/CDA1 family)
MSLFLLGYHRIADGVTDNLHCLPPRQFREQMHHLQRAGYAVLSWREFAAQPAWAPERARLHVGVTFDDGYASDLESARFLSSLGYDAMFFIATDYIGRNGYLSRDAVLELHRLGMGIGSHSHRHAHLAPLDDANIESELAQSKHVLEDIVQSPIKDLSFPGGSYDTRVVNIGRRMGYANFFTTEWGVNTQKHRHARVFRRTMMVRDVELDRFDALLRLRNYYSRQLTFHAKELAKKTLGANGYFKLRRTLMSLVR